MHVYQKNVRRWPTDEFMLDRRQRRQVSVKTTLGQRLVLAGYQQRCSHCESIWRYRWEKPKGSICSLYKWEDTAFCLYRSWYSLTNTDWLGDSFGENCFETAKTIEDLDRYIIAGYFGLEDCWVGHRLSMVAVHGFVTYHTQTVNMW